MLAEGQLVVSRAAGIFPDGLLFDIPDADPPPPSKALADFFDPGATSLDVYLTIPDYRERGPNVAIAERNGGSRYLAEVTAFRDENTGVGEKPVQIARKNLRLLAENENREGCSVLRIANVERTNDGSWAEIGEITHGKTRQGAGCRAAKNLSSDPVGSLQPVRGQRDNIRIVNAILVS
jgi:type VI secretion system protein ImpJ